MLNSRASQSGGAPPNASSASSPPRPRNPSISPGRTDSSTTRTSKRSVSGGSAPRKIPPVVQPASYSADLDSLLQVRSNFVFVFQSIFHILLNNPFVRRLTSPTVYSNLVPKLSMTDSLMSLQTSRLRLRTKVNSRHQVDFPSNLNRLHIDNHRSMYKRLMLCSSINQLHVNYRLLSKCP